MAGGKRTRLSWVRSVANEAVCVVRIEGRVAWGES